MTIYYAKTKETYEDHLKKSLDVASEYLEGNKKALERLCGKLGLTFEELSALCLRAVFFHDMGKLGDVFQKYIKKKRKEEQGETVERGEPYHFFRHELLSARLLSQLCPPEGGFPYDVWAVLGHHKRLDTRWTSFQREKEDSDPDALTEEQIKFGLDFKIRKLELDSASRERLFASGLFKNSDDEDEDEDEDENWVQSFYAQWFKPIYKAQKEKLNRTMAVLLRGILRYADWQASAPEGDRMKPCHSKVDLSKRMQDRMEARLSPDELPYAKRPFQEACEAQQGNVLAIAPTGSGKTEAALLWATNQEPGRVIFLMPTKVTSNSLYERMKEDYFNPKDCGLSHSGAAEYHTQKAGKNNDASREDREEQDSQSYELRALRKNKAFMAPVMVATVDQFLMTSFNVVDWFSRELAAVGASVIFDEIHAYDSYTLALITESIRRIQELGGRVMVMSATMPTKLRDHFQKQLGVDAPILADDDMMKERRCSWEYDDEKPLEAYDEEILQALKQEKKVAVVVNTVREAQKQFERWRALLSDRLPEKADRMMCYHSNFIMRDRTAKESRLLNKQDKKRRPADIDLLIATQVIEVSLDISFDLMLSECAPIDDLIQRAGRCNRFKKSDDGRFVVFPISETAKKYVYKNAGTVLQHTVEILRECSAQKSELKSEEEISKMLERAYLGFDIYDDAYTAGQNLISDLQPETDIFDRSISDSRLKALTTRQIDIVKIPVIPKDFADDVHKLLEAGGSRKIHEIAQYQVSIPLSSSRKYPVTPLNTRGTPILICDVDYDEDIGVHLQADPADVLY